MIDTNQILAYVLARFGPYRVDKDDFAEFLSNAKDYELYISPVVEGVEEFIEFGIRENEPRTDSN